MYQKPKVKLHREFVYLAYDTILNSLSALEAGKVDEIIQKTSEASDKGLEGSLKVGPAKAGASKKQQAQMEFELVRTRTRFSAFEAWYQHLVQREAIGRFNIWDDEVRDAIEVGDTIEFPAVVSLSPLYLLFTTYSAFVEQVNKPGSVFKMTPQEVKEAKNIAAMMNAWISPGGVRTILTYLAPEGIPKPRMVGAFSEKYLVGGLANVQGEFTVIGQVDAKLQGTERMSVIRTLSDAPPTPMEIETIENGLQNLQGEASEGLGVHLLDEDLRLMYPDVVVRPLAVFK